MGFAGVFAKAGDAGKRVANRFVRGRVTHWQIVARIVPFPQKNNANHFFFPNNAYLRAVFETP